MPLKITSFGRLFSKADDGSVIESAELEHRSRRNLVSTAEFKIEYTLQICRNLNLDESVVMSNSL